MRILVTGGAGYVGSTLVPLLLEQGHRVRVLDALKFGGHGLLACCQNRFFELMKGDVCDEAAVARALDGIEAVVHLAAIVGYPACKKEPHVAQTTNVEGTRTLLRLRQPDQRFVFASTGSIYGQVPDYVCNENTPAPRSRSTARPRPRPSNSSSTPATASPTATPPPSASAPACGSTSCRTTSPIKP